MRGLDEGDEYDLFEYEFKLVEERDGEERNELPPLLLPLYTAFDSCGLNNNIAAPIKAGRNLILIIDILTGFLWMLENENVAAFIRSATYNKNDKNFMLDSEFP